MLIKSMETILTCPGRNYLIVKITTEDGVTGYGDATLNGRELSVKEALDSHLSKYLVGMDAERITDIWELERRPCTDDRLGGYRHGAVGYQG